MDIIDLKATLHFFWNHQLNTLTLFTIIIATCLTLIIRGKTSQHSKNVCTTPAVCDENETEEDELSNEEPNDGSCSEKENGDNSYSEEIQEEIVDIPFHTESLSAEEMIIRSKEFFQYSNKRRSCRQISSEKIPIEVIENIIKTAGTSPSGAHTQPWTYVVVANPNVKQQIREIIEHEEHINYTRRMGDEWVSDLNTFKTSWKKPYLTEAPYIILLFRQIHGFWKDGRKRTHYYSEISTSISAGFLMLAIHQAGLISVSTTPMNCGPQLRQLLNRPKNEKLLLLFPVGLPLSDAKVPDLKRKPLDQIMVVV